MFEIFVIGSLWFWLLIAGSFILATMFTDWEWPGFAFTTLVATLVLLQWCGNVDIIHWVIANPFWVAVSVPGYFLLGTVWAIIKWGLFVREERVAYNERLRQWLRARNIAGNVVPEELKEEWYKELRFDYKKQTADGKPVLYPEPNEHKSSILIWMSYWPFSMVWTVLNDPIRKICRHIYQQIVGLLEKMSAAAFKDVDKDMKLPEVKPPEAPQS